MVHQRIVKPTIECLDEERAKYFSKVVRVLEDDPRTQRMPNLIYLVLREIVESLPTHLPEEELIELLFSFVQSNRGRLGRLIYDENFVKDPLSIKIITNDFIRDIISIVFEKIEKGEIQEEKGNIRRYSWPYGNVDLPYVDMK